MKKIWPWIKSNLIVVICTVVILLVLPAGWIVSSMWNEKIRDEQQKKVKADFDKVKSSVVKYAAPTLDPSTPAVELDSAPNAKATAYFKDLNARVKGEAEGVVKLAQEHNQQGHTVLVEGLLPSGTGPEAQSKAFLLAGLVMHVPPTEPSKVYTKLFESMHAGDPPSGSALFDVLRDAEERERAAILGGASRQLTAEEQAKITRKLVELRAAEYQRRAREISFYADPDVLGNQIPRSKPKEAPSIRDAFQWQADYWLVSDLLNAVRLTDTDERGQPLPVDRSPIKRIVKITLRPSAFSAQRSEGAAEPESTEAVAAPASDAQVVPDYTRSISGRWSGPGNGVYDIRKADLELIVASAQIPAMFDGFARSNFITITDCDLYEVDLWQELERGFYYGSESVVRAKIEVEVVWLRTWTVPFMPAEIKKKLGIPEAPAAAEPPK